jgi:hypothetical protein
VTTTKPKQRRTYPEHAICKHFMLLVNNLIARKLTLKPFVIFHIPNEQEVTGNIAKDKIRNARRKEIGVMSGVLDYLVFWEGGMGFLEAKVPGNSLSPNQKLFCDLCDALGVEWEVFKSPDEGLRILAEWGLISESMVR